MAVEEAGTSVGIDYQRQLRGKSNFALVVTATAEGAERYKDSGPADACFAEEYHTP